MKEKTQVRTYLKRTSVPTTMVLGKNTHCVMHQLDILIYIIFINLVSEI